MGFPAPGEEPARIIVLDAAKYSATTIFAISAVILALAAAYHIQRRARSSSGRGTAVTPSRGDSPSAG